jgi:hypothetical protein
MNYENIARALQFYGERGYVYMDDAPWIVGQAAYFATKPPSATDVVIDTDPTGKSALLGGYPVASGEQSFIQMMLDGQPLKRAICVTPCFRAEPRTDMLHRPYFIKAELINAQDVDEGHLVQMVHDACCFYEQFFPVRVVRTSPAGEVPQSFDIVEKGTRFELGSYGIREVRIDGRLIDWIYGTACAEPRLSTAIAKHSRNVGK